MSPLDYLYSRLNYERVSPVSHSGAFRLQRMRRLLGFLDHPQHAYAVVHVGGTKGKGSTCSMISSMLHAGGKRVGLYTSPHLERLEERFRVDGGECSHEQMLELIEVVRVAAQRCEAQGEGAPTFFELTTAMAFEHFRRSQCDIVVLEVGLGGRLDSTNVCEPLVSVITSVGLDHQHILGDTHEKIAFEKAGIIKPGIPVVSGVLHEGAAEVIAKVAAERAAPLLQIGRDFSFQINPLSSSRGQVVFDFLSQSQELHDRAALHVGLEGAHQAQNASIALAVMDVVHRTGCETSDAARRQGLAQVQCAGRIENFGIEPEILLDTAHNIDSMKALLEVLRNRPVQGKTIVVFGTSADKDADAMLAMLADQADHVILTRYWSNPRWFDPQELARMCSSLSWKVPESASDLPAYGVVATPLDALEKALQFVGPEGRVVVCGSFFLAAELRPYLGERKKNQN